jgi:hypothetical protein
MVTLAAPDGGEAWVVGTSQTIAWSASDDVGVSAVDLHLSTDGGATYPQAIATGLAAAGTFAWTVPAPPAARARVRVVARDAAGNAASDTSRLDFAIVADPNLVGNGGFESGLAGWTRHGSATLTQASEGFTGARALQIRGSSSSSFGCDDQPNWIGTTAARGAVYRITARVKTPTGSRGRVRLRVYEYVGSSQQGSTANSSTVTLSAAWALLSMDYTVRSANSSLSLRVTDEPSASGETFLVDDVSIRLLSAPPPDAAPVVTAPAAVAATAGVPLTFQVTAADADGPAIASLTQSGKPSAASFQVNSARTLGTFTWTPSASSVHATPYVVVFTAANTKSGADTTSITVSPAPTPPPPPPGANLCGNGDFESGTTGWGTYGNATLSAVAGGRAGQALQVRGSSSFGADDVPNWLPAPLVKGAVYRIRCWVQGVGAASGSVKIRVYEFLGSSQQGSTTYSQVLPLSPSWQPLTVDYTVRTAGSTLSIRITDAASSTESFLVDDVVIEALGGTAMDAGGEGTAGAPAVFAAWFHPNPARAEGTLSFSTTRPGPIEVDLVDVSGRQVRRLVSESRLAAGKHQVAVGSGRGAGRLPAGIYFYRVRSGEGRLQGRLVLLP